jgi:hypothetical protein
MITSDVENTCSSKCYTLSFWHPFLTRGDVVSTWSSTYLAHFSLYRGFLKSFIIGFKTSIISLLVLSKVFKTTIVSFLTLTMFLRHLRSHLSSLFSFFLLRQAIINFLLTAHFSNAETDVFEHNTFQPC